MEAAVSDRCAAADTIPGYDAGGAPTPECGPALVLVDNAGIARMSASRSIASTALPDAESVGRAVGARSPTTRSRIRAELYSPTGDLRLQADLAAARPVGGAPGWGWAPIDHHLQSGTPWPGCQRGFLRRMVDEARERGYELQAAWELECVVGADHSEGFEALHQGPGTAR